VVITRNNARLGKSSMKSYKVLLAVTIINVTLASGEKKTVVKP
jgi:hypothetical protein